MPKSKSPAALIIVGHGSKMQGFEKPMLKVIASLKKDRQFSFVSAAYLEINQPSISLAIDQAVQKGAKIVKVLPYFLLTGRHVKTDIPQIVEECQKKYQTMAKIILCPYLGFHSKIVEVVKERASKK